MFRKTQVCRAALLALAGVGAVTALPVQAQQALEKVEITGSLIKRIPTEGALPVQTFTQEDFKKSGATTVTDFIQQLPAMQGFSTTARSVGGSGGGITTASIHDIGEQYTLVLLNGRRVAPADDAGIIDLNTIPLAAIERVEVLTDGASAIYGADAIAGVVNFILKKGATPFQIDARMDKPQHSGGEGYNFGLSKGFGSLDSEGFTLFGSLSYDRKKQLKASQRDFAKTGIITFKDQQGRTLYFFNGSSRSVPPNVDVVYPRVDDPANPGTLKANPLNTSLSPYLQLSGDCPPAHVQIGRQCFFDYTSTVEIQPEEERTSLFGSGEVKLGSSGFKAFADVAIVDAHILARIAPYPAEFAMDPAHPYYAKYIQPYLTPEQQAATPSLVNVKYRLYDLGNRAYDYHTKTNHFVVGVDGRSLGWDLNGAVTVSKQKQLQDYAGGFPLADKFNEALTNQLVDPFPYTLGTMPADQLAALRNTQWTGTYNTTDISMVGVDLRGSREVFTAPGGTAMLGVGAEFRKTGFEITANPQVANAEILFDDPQPEYDLSRKSAGAYAELLVPVAKGLEVTGALRHDVVSGVTDSRSNTDIGERQSATTAKLNARYQVKGNLLLRASAGTGFRTASMREIAQPKVDFGVTANTYNCPFNANYDPLGYIAAGYVCADGLQMEVFNSGNPNLKPEKSKQWSLGMVFEPAENMAATIDFWAVNITDAVTRPDERLILGDPAKFLDLYTTKFKASNQLTYVAINQAPVNLGKTENRGIDWDFVIRHRTDWGPLTGRVSGTYLIKSRYTQPGTDDVWESSLGRLGSNDAVSLRNIIRASGTLDVGQWSHTLTMNYHSSYKDVHYTADECFVDDGVDCVDVQLDIPEYYTFDWQTRWTARKGLELSIGIINISDVKPPLSLRVGEPGHQLGYDPRYASPMGRTFYLTGSYKF